VLVPMPRGARCVSALARREAVGDFAMRLPDPDAAIHCANEAEVRSCFAIAFLSLPTLTLAADLVTGDNGG
jgi:hypothetical protein